VSRAVFVDTTAWFALADRDDTYHGEARGIFAALQRSHRSLITTNHIISETYTLVRIRLGSAAALRALRQLRTSTLVRRVQVAEPWEEAAEALLERYGDQSFSYVDATSFITMQRLGLREAFAFDRHFATAGFLIAR
jgi:predicted nucleic acid-binding protein